MSRFLYVILLLAGLQASAMDIQPFWTEPVSLARMLVFPLALEFADRLNIAPQYQIEIWLDPKVGMHMHAPDMDLFVGAREARARQRFAAANSGMIRALDQETRSLTTGGGLLVSKSFHEDRAGAFNFRITFKSPASVKTSDLQRWISHTEIALIQAHPNFGQRTGLVLADFLNSVVGHLGDSKSTLYERLVSSPEEKEAVDHSEWTRTERQLKLFGLSLFTPEARYATSLKNLFNRPAECAAALERTQTL